MQFAEWFAEMCNKHNVTPTTVAYAVGVSSASASYWITGRNQPKRTTLLKIEEYFGETFENKKDPSVMSDEEVDKELYEIMTELKDRPEMRALFHAAKGTDADNVRRVADMLEGFKRQ